MTLGERIKACRQNAGMSQEKVAEWMGVSRQAVTKWEVNQSAPSTENLFKLAELFGTTVDMLLASTDSGKQSTAEQIYYLYKMEKEKKLADKRERRKKNVLAALLVVCGYLVLYLVGRMIWCDMDESSFIGWLVLAQPSGEHSYLYGWLLSSDLYWIALAISAIPSLWGKRKFSAVASVGFVVGLAAGMVFGPNPEGAATGQTHFGWAIWGAIFLVSIVVGIIIVCPSRKNGQRKAPKSGMII